MNQGKCRANGEANLFHIFRVAQKFSWLGCSDEVIHAAILCGACADLSLDKAEIKQMLVEFKIQIGIKVSAFVFALVGEFEEFEQACEEFPDILIIKMMYQLDELENLGMFDTKTGFKKLNMIQRNYLPLYSKKLLQRPELAAPLQKIQNIIEKINE